MSAAAQIRRRLRFQHARRQRFFSERRHTRLWGEMLEPRLMMAVDTPDIVVGRTLSAYSINDVQNGDLRVTYTVYNQEAEDVSGVLLTSTLQPGVSFTTASQPPDQNGEELAWSLGTIPAYGRASVELTVHLANNSVLTIDDGAEAFSTLKARASSDAAPAAVLKSTPLPAALLASTIDANTTDPFIQEQAARLDYDPQRIIDFLQDDVGYESYVGSLRGARGTLWSSAGNALDEASLGVALFRASGIPAQYVGGTLTDPLAQQLILSMFPDDFQSIGVIPAGTPVSDPANDSQLLAETKNHYWIQFDAGLGITDIDTTIPGATAGQAFAAVTSIFAELPDALRHHLKIRLNVEEYSQAGAAFGFGSGLSEHVALEQEFSSAELYGRTLTIGHLISETSIPSPIFTSRTLTYSPYLIVGDAGSDFSTDPIIQGTDFQEVMTNFPFGTKLLTGLFLEMEQSAPTGTSQTFEKTLVDRIGYAARHNGTGSSSVDPNGPPALSPFDLVTVSAISGQRPPSAAATAESGASAMSRFSEFATRFSALTPGRRANEVVEGLELVRELLGNALRSRIADFEAQSSFTNEVNEAALKVRGYLATPRLTVALTRLEKADTATPEVVISLDLLASKHRVIVAPGQALTAGYAYNVNRGLLETVLEASVMSAVSGNGEAITAPIGTKAIFDEAARQDIAVVTLEAVNIPGNLLPEHSAEVRARVTQALLSGHDVLIPERPVEIRGASRTAWYEIDRNTGETVSVLDDGSHGILDFTFIYLNEAAIAAETSSGALFLAGFIAGFFEGTVYRFAMTVLLSQFISMNGSQTIQDLSTLKGYVHTLIDIGNEFVKYRHPAFLAGYALGKLSVNSLTADPPLADGTATPFPGLPNHAVLENHSFPVNIQAGTVAGSHQATNAAIAGDLRVQWSSSTSGVYSLTNLAANGVIRNQLGDIVSTGALSFESTQPVSATVTGNVAHDLNGNGALDAYSSATSGLGLSAEWNSYSADLTGAINLVFVAASGSTLNGVALVPGRYTIETSQARLTGDGTTSGSATFSTAVSIDSAAALLRIGPGANNLTINGTGGLANTGISFSGFAGSIEITAAGAVDNYVVNGSATQVLQVVSDTSVAGDQNTWSSIATQVNASLSGQYAVQVLAPIGWFVRLDAAGATVKPPPGVLPGDYAIRIVAASLAEPRLIAASDVVVSVTATAPGLALAVSADQAYTIPYNGAQVPTSFRATLQNLGPTADTYDLTFPNPPAGFNILRGAESLTVPAGETGISGIYLQPNGVLPAPGTSISFTVTATSRTNPLITETRTFTFAMPTVAAVTVDANPVKVSTTPGAPVNAKVVIKNVGNVPYNLAINASLPNGLTVSGLTTPVSLAVGQTTTQTVTFTPASGTPLNTTLTPTFTYGPAVAANQAAVLQVNVSDSQVEAGQALTVSADVLSAALQAQQGSVVFVVRNSLNAVVQTSAATPVTLGVVAATQKVNLGAITTTGLAAGEYTIEATVRDASNAPLPGAVGVGKFVVSLPISASQDAMPNTVHEGLELTYVTGNATVESSVKVGQQPLVSLIDTNGTALNVALSGNLAYVAGTKEVTIVDLSNPASPQIVGSFGADKLSQDAFNVAQIVGSNLVIGSSSTVNAEVTNISVYSLANPLSPQFVGTTAIPYRFISDLLVQGTTAVIPTTGVGFSLPGTIVNQFGDVVALNLAGTPTVADVLFNTNGSPNGGTTRQVGGTIVNSSLAYIGSSTFTGSNTTTGNGRVLAVNIANPADLSLAADVTIPGIKQVLDIAIDGNRALVVGSTGGIRNPFNGFNDLGLEGTLALAVLDITNPATPIVIGTTKVTEATFPSGTAPGLLQAVSLGNGQFAVSGVKIPQQGPAIVVVDATNASDIQTSNLATPALVNGLSVSGQYLRAASAAGLANYRIAAIVSTPVHVEVQVPNGTGVSVDSSSFNVAPTQTIVGAGFTTLVWNLTLNAGRPTQELTWNENITGMIPGSTRSVTLGTTIHAVSPGGATDLSLPAQVVAATPSTQTLQIPVRVAVPGADAIAAASVTAAQTGRTDLANRLSDLSTALTKLVQNPGDAVALSQSLASIDAIRVLLDSECCLGQISDDLLAARTTLAAATTPASVQAAVVSVGNVLDQLADRLVDLQRHDYRLDLLVNQFTVQPNVPARFDVFLQNLGTQATTYDFVLNGVPASATAVFDQTSITLAPGEGIGVNGATQDVYFTITQAGSSLAAFGFTLSAIPREAPLLVCPTNGSLALRSEFIGVASVALGTNFTQAGPTVPVTANLIDSVNSPTNVQVYYEVRNASAQVIFTSATVAATLTVATPLQSVVLPGFNTTGVATGTYSVVALVKDNLGVLIPGASATSTLLIGTPLSATLTVADRGGLKAEFFDFTTSLSAIPNFTGLTPDVTRLDNTVNYTNTGGSFPGLDSRFSDTFASRHTGVIKIPATGSYKFYISSDDGAKLYIDGTQVINNDGVHGQNEVAVTLTLTAGFHDVRIEYFENGGGAALIFSWSGPGIAKQVVPESVLYPQPTTLGTSVTLQPGTQTVNSELKIDSQTAFTDPLTFRGNVDTNGLANSVVTYGNVAYVSGSNDISIVDISNPASPQVLSTFAGSLIVQNGFNISRIVGDKLIVGSTVNTNANGFNVLIYDLTNPLSPSLVSNTSINYRFISDFLTAGSTVLATTNGVYYFGGGSIFDQFGDVVSLDVTNPAAPGVGDALFNNRGPLDGGDTRQTGGTFVNNNTAYIASTTSTGGDTATGTGRILVVDTTNPASLSLVRPVLIPGTYQIIDVAVQGNRALAVGSTGPIQNPFNGTNDGFTGNLSLTLLDTTDPLNPIIIGSTLVTSATFPRGAIVAKLDAVSLGNGLFAVSEAIVNNQPVLLLVDPSDPNNLVVSFSSMPALQNGIEVVGNKLYTTSSAGLSIFDIGQIQSIPLTASVQIPKNTGVSIVANSFNIPPSQIISGPTFDTLVWNRNLAFGASQFDFTWQSTVTNLLPGEVREVTLNATINSSVTITLPETTVRTLPAARITLGLTPPSQTLQPGDATNFVVTVNNPSSTAGTFSLTTAGIPAEWVTLAAGVQVPANGSVQVPLRIATDVFAQLGDQGFTVIATNGSQQGAVQGNLSFIGPARTVDPESHGVVAAIAPNLVTTGQGLPGTFTVRLTNTGSATDTFNLAATLPPGFTMSFEKTSVVIPPGASNFREITVQVTPPVGTIAAVYPFTVQATSAALPAISGSANANLSVVTAGVDASLSPAAAPAETTFLLTVRNTGSTTDTFDLTLAGPGALVSTLAQNNVTLAPGASTVVNVNVAAINFAVQPSLQLAAIATSRNNPNVKDLATANITIPLTFAMDSEFEQDTITLAAPGTGTFLLLVDNLGNGEDAYEARIIATSGPLSATLIGLDGAAVRTVPIFRLPGLSTGAIVLNANLAGVGSGTITVQVRSLTNDTIVSQSVATLRSTITDFGDAPDTYGTSLAHDGARHLALGPQLGANRDPEIDATLSANALGDDNNAPVDDEDGVVLPGLFVAGTCDCSGTGLGNQIIVNATEPGYLDAWIDFNRDGDFDASEAIASSFRVLAGANTLVPTIPTTASQGASFARFRLSSTGGLGPTGAASDGEVEDYAVQLFNPSLGSANIIADPLNLNSRVLYVKGTQSVDAIVVRQTSAAMVTVYIAPTLSIGSFALNSFDRIVICGLGGNDSIAVESPIFKPTVIYGDEGTDTISGGSGPDMIFGGPGVDTITGNAGDDVISGGTDLDTLSGGTGFDRLVESGVGAITLTNTQFKSDAEFNTIAQFEAATLTGSAASDTFNISGWDFPATILGGGGTNTIVDGGNGSFILALSTLSRTISATTRIATFSEIQNANLTGGSGNNTFNLVAWPFAATLSGAAGSDSFVVSGDVSYSLSDTMLLRPNLGMIRLNGFENATLSAGASDNTFTVTGWTKAATVQGGAGNDKLISAANVNQSLSNTSLTRTGLGTISLSSIEQAELTGGAGNNTISAASFGGQVKLDGGLGNDILTSGTGLAILLGGAGNDTLQAGTGRTVMIGGQGLDKLTGGTNDDLLISGQTVYDSNSEALAAILAEWSSANSYTDRVAHLTGTTGGLNNGKFLNGANVSHDTAVDFLMGGLGSDLFFAKLTNPSKDILGDKASGETAL